MEAAVNINTSTWRASFFRIFTWLTYHAANTRRDTGLGKLLAHVKGKDGRIHNHDNCQEVITFSLYAGLINTSPGSAQTSRLVQSQIPSSKGIFHPWPCKTNDLALRKLLHASDTSESPVATAATGTSLLMSEHPDMKFFSEMGHCLRWAVLIQQTLLAH